MPIPQNFHPDSQCYDTSVVSGKNFYRNIQSTPWSSKSGLAGKDVGQLRVVDLTRKGLDDYALRNPRNGEFQSAVFVPFSAKSSFYNQPPSIDPARSAGHRRNSSCSSRQAQRICAVHGASVGRRFADIEAPRSCGLSLKPKPTEQVNDELERAKSKLQAAGFCCFISMHLDLSGSWTLIDPRF